jgi:uncharacterized membrane protein YraQ (UPF0718 family)
MLMIEPVIEQTTLGTLPQLIYYLIAGFLIAIIALILIAHSFGWKKLLAGYLVLALSVATFGYTALNVTSLLQLPINTSIENNNISEIKTWGQKTYGLDLTTDQVNSLLNDADKQNVSKISDNIFGNLILELQLGDEVQPSPHQITLIKVDNSWKLVEYNDKGNYKELFRLNEETK